ncbi:hypothetical protein AGMMS49579_02670 [Spirochaetia bacterium]|nr:hypothetical protein AGMMS49579_02670 [Spirochaetia bacterium]
MDIDKKINIEDNDLMEFFVKKGKIIFLFIIALSLIYYIIINHGTYNIFTIKQETIDNISLRFDDNSLTKEDKKTLKRIYDNIIFFGWFIYPEASNILKHYIYGNGNDLEIISRYFFKSAVIKKSLENKQNIELIGPITLRIQDDPRIAYAINGFYIKNKNNVEIFQKIDFAKINDRHTYTTFNILNREIKIPDRLIRTFETDGGCKEFTVRIINTK